MKKKKIHRYIAFFLLITVFQNTNNTHAEVILAEPNTEIRANVPNFDRYINQDGNNDVLVRLQELQREEKKTFDEAYSIVRNEYHDRMNDIFNERMSKMENDIISSNNDRDKVCSPFKYDEETDALNVSRQMITNFREYEAALEVYIKNPPFSGKEVLYEDAAYRLNSIQSTLRNEIAISYMSLEKSLNIYNELRMWFPIHRDMLCLIEELNTYRDSLKNFMDQVVRMPKKFYNYGSRYQH